MENQALPAFSLLSLLRPVPSVDGAQPRVMASAQALNTSSDFAFENILQQFALTESAPAEFVALGLASTELTPAELTPADWQATPDLLAISPDASGLIKHFPVTDLPALIRETKSEQAAVAIKSTPTAGRTERPDVNVSQIEKAATIDLSVRSPESQVSLIPVVAQGATQTQRPLTDVNQLNHLTEKLRSEVTIKPDQILAEAKVPEIKHHNGIKDIPAPLPLPSVEMEGEVTLKTMSATTMSATSMSTTTMPALMPQTESVQMVVHQAPQTSQHAASIQMTEQPSVTQSSSVKQPFLQPEIAQRSFGQTVVQMIKQGDQKMEFRLDPPELGRVTLTVSVDRDAVSLQAITATPAARDLLLLHGDRLREALNSESLTLGQMSVDVGSQKESDTSEQSSEYLPTADGCLESNGYQSAQEQFRVHGGRLLDHFV
ncbi:flagellar hook-length control protein FliK [Endozoicomonas sp. 4G]|uniref:flagellar hook-length control protein FliK n=1 Tax=Endozoicomonas sp. 4G TaxID=2872754 RepID=UPI002078A13B|nr:flagellar hook-length control protein FliK [Endozoicomonas sp. 4G]